MRRAKIQTQRLLGFRVFGQEVSSFEWSSPRCRGKRPETSACRMGVWIRGDGFRGALAGMDMTWVTDRIAVGGGIWNDRNMIDVVAAGITHIIDMQIEFDDTRLAEPYGVRARRN